MAGRRSLGYSHCCFWKNDDPGRLPAGKGHIAADPLFVKGPGGEHYLAQAAAGQPAGSPCLDAGSQPASASAVRDLTTRTDGAKDTGQADIGFHFALSDRPADKSE